MIIEPIVILTIDFHHQRMTTIMNNTIKLGLILAAIGLITTLLYRYVIGFDFMFSWKSGLVSFAISIVITIILARKMLRDPEGERLGYGEAVKKLFIAYLISTSIGALAGAALFSNDQELKETFTELNINAQETGIRMGASLTGASEADIEVEVEKYREGVASGEVQLPPYQYAWSNLPLALFSSAVVSIFLALILALFIREKETQYA